MKPLGEITYAILDDIEYTEQMHKRKLLAQSAANNGIPVVDIPMANTDIKDDFIGAPKL